EISCIDPLKKGRTTAKERDPVKPVSDAVVEQTLPHMPPVVADMVRLQRLVGCRPGEVVAITPGMVDRTSDVWEIRLANHKTAWRGHERTIYVGPKAQEILRRYLLRGADVPCFSPIEATEQRREVREANRKTPPSCGNVRGSKCKADPLRAPSQQFTAG
ncbi:MAG: site-specific integrase, partial [Pirellulaceae bacterium]